MRATSHPRVIGNVTVPATNKTVLAKHSSNPLADSKEPQSHTKGGFQREFAASETWYLYVVGERRAKLRKVFAMADDPFSTHSSRTQPNQPTTKISVGPRGYLSPRSASPVSDCADPVDRSNSGTMRISFTFFPLHLPSPRLLLSPPTHVHVFPHPLQVHGFSPLPHVHGFLLTRMFTVFSSPSDRPHLASSGDTFP